ncbi:acyltransferase domain-containing protein [Nocardia sp. NPDC060256]|uniref:acyltransferase domain-containing protein n=1 Tax=unclassified Nocardia TaxID=2637762 RepID=UPI00365AEF24
MNGQATPPTPRTVFLVPGQGGDPRCALHELYRADSPSRATVDGVLGEIERASGDAGQGLREVLLSEVKQPVMGPGIPQLASYAISVVLDRLLTAAGLHPDVIVGQSFGEIAALVCAGVFDVPDGTRAVGALNAAFRGFEGRGAMVLVLASVPETRALLAEVGPSDLVVACVNSPKQTIVSGPTEAIAALLERQGDGPRLVRLAVPYASHHPGLVVVADRFRANLCQTRQRPLRVPVYSPVGRRAYADTDDLHEALVDCVTKPVDLVEALQHAGSQHTQFIELGVGDGLCRCVQATLPSAGTLAPLAGELSWLTGTTSKSPVSVRQR